MNWRDFFYFSKGERRALILLLSLISAAWLTLVLTDNTSGLSAGSNMSAKVVLHPVCIYSPDSIFSVNNDTLSKEGLQEEPKVKNSIPNETIVPKIDKRPFYQTTSRTEKFAVGTIVELNTADTTTLKKVPGIGTAFSNRIIKYRNLLGGFYSVTQLSEVYGIEEDRYNALKEWFCVNPELISKRSVNQLPADSLSRHPYINYRQARVMKQICRQKGKLEGWDNLLLLEEFTEFDIERIGPYISFE